MLTRILNIIFLIINCWFSVTGQDATYPFDKGNNKLQGKESYTVRWSGISKEKCKEAYHKTIYAILDSDNKKLNNNAGVMKDAPISIVDSLFHEKDKKWHLEITLSPSIMGDASTVKMTLQAPDKAHQDQIATLEFQAKKEEKAGNGCTVETRNFITEAMLKSVSGSDCNSCNDTASIYDKSYRRFNTDYLISYDPSKGVFGDVYTICKHLFTKIEKLPTPVKDQYKTTQKKYLEQYKKKNPTFFAPPVGSSITFEAINIPLNNITGLKVDERDLFNEGSAQFSNIITRLVTAQIVTPLTPQTGEGDEKTKSGQQASGEPIPQEKKCKNDQLLRDLAVLNNEVQSYISAFRISSCAINAHQSNIRNILASINKYFEINAVGIEDLEQKLHSKIDDVVIDENEKSLAKKNATAIATALKSLNELKPLVYSTIRAKNKDFIEVKYLDANGAESKPENIRMSGGMKIDFSAGFIITGLKDYSYVLKPTTVPYDPDDTTAFGGHNGSLLKRDTTGNVITKENTGKAEVGVSILTHFYPRLSSHYNIGGAVGLMTTTDLNLRFMLGGSFIVSSLFGSDHRISFTGGVVWGKVKRLSVKDEPYLDEPNIINGQPNFYSSTPSLSDMNDHSWFFSVNFNFGGK